MSEYEGYLDVALLIMGGYLWIKIFSHIRYLLTWYGAKYVLFLVLCTLLYAAAFGSDSFLANAQDCAIITFAFWVVVSMIKIGISVAQNPHVQRGWKNYNNLGAFNDNWAPKEGGSRVFGGASPPTKKDISSKYKSQKEKGTDSKSTLRDTSAASSTAKSEKKREREAPSPKNTSKTPISKKSKLCATCARWGGPRELHPGRSHALIESTNVKGKCGGGEFNRHSVPAAGKCKRYERWAALD